MNPWVFWIGALFIITGLWFTLAENSEEDGAPLVNIGIWIFVISWIVGTV